MNELDTFQEATGIVQVEQARAIQEAQAQIMLAKRFPRDETRAMDLILKDCGRPKLAEAATYAYKRGGQLVTGASIRLAEAIVRRWGNIDSGLRELSRDAKGSTVQAFAYDLESNSRQTVEFHVPHVRYTKRETKALDDPRDIYEMVANLGARRKRACILALIPQDVVEDAVRQCELTITQSMGAPAEEITKMVDAFGRFKVTPDMIVKRLGHSMEATVAAEVIQLRSIYRSLADGMATVDQFFDVAEQAQQQAQDLESKLTKPAKPKAKPKNAKVPDDVPGFDLPPADEMMAKIGKAETSDDVAELESLACEYPEDTREDLLAACAKRRTEAET